MPDPRADQPRLRPLRPESSAEEQRDACSVELRPWSPADAETFLEIVGRSPDLERQLPGRPRTLAEAVALIRDHLVPAPHRWVWAVCLADVPVGCVRIEVTPEPGIPAGPAGRGWVSYWVDAAHRGRGITTTAVATVCEGVLAPGGGGLRRLELGYRENNPASAAVARKAGFRVEGREREKFMVDGVPVDVLTAARLAEPDAPMRATASEPTCHVAGLHHLELWTGDIDALEPAWSELLGRLGWRQQSTWPGGRAWAPSAHEAETAGEPGVPYLVVEQSADLRPGNHRCGVGMNHVALTCPDRVALDGLRRDAPSWGWRELFAQRYPHAGGPQQQALYLENEEGIEVEIVVV